MIRTPSLRLETIHDKKVLWKLEVVPYMVRYSTWYANLSKRAWRSTNSGTLDSTWSGTLSIMIAGSTVHSTPTLMAGGIHAQEQYF
jgi:hypothetical protein